MPKIKPFVWENGMYGVIRTETPFGWYVIQEFTDCGFYLQFDEELGQFETIELAKRFAFDDFKRRLEEALGEPVGYDLEIDENC